MFSYRRAVPFGFVRAFWRVLSERDLGLVSASAIFLLLVPLFAVPTVLQAEDGSKTLFDIQDRKVFIVGSDVPYGVMEYYDEEGKLTGIDIEIARLLADDLGVTLRVSNMPFDKLFQALDDGRIDAIASAVTITVERQQKMLFSRPYMDAGMVIAVRDDNQAINGKDDLFGKKVGVLSGTVGEDLLRKSNFVGKDDLVVFQENEARLDALLTGKLDAAVVHFASKSVSGLRLIQPPLTQSFYGIVVRKEDKALMEKIDASLRELSRSGELDRIKNQFLNPGQS